MEYPWSIHASWNIMEHPWMAWLTTISLGDLETPFLLRPHKAVLAAGTRMPILLRWGEINFTFFNVPNEAVSKAIWGLTWKTFGRNNLLFFVAEATTKLLPPTQEQVPSCRTSTCKAGWAMPREVHAPAARIHGPRNIGTWLCFAVRIQNGKTSGCLVLLRQNLNQK